MNVFEQILSNEKVINDNIVQIAANVQQLYNMLQPLMQPINEPLQPTISGDESSIQ